MKMPRRLFGRHGMVAPMVVLGLTFGSSLAGADDLNPVFSTLPQMAGPEMASSTGKGTTVNFDATLNFNGEATDTVPDLGIATGNNVIGDNAFSGMGSSFTNIVQNTGNNVVVQNLLAVNMNMIETPP